MSTPPQPETPEAQPQLRPFELRPVKPLTLASSQGGGSNSSPILRLLIAAVVVLLVIGAYVYFNEKPAPVIGEVLHLTAYPIHSDSKANQYASSSIAPVETKFDEIIVIAEVRLHNQSEGPVFLADMSALLKLPNEEDRSVAAGSADFGRVFVAYPQLAPIKQQPLLRDITIPAGQAAQGQLVFNYPITKEQWDQRKSLELTLNFTHQKDLILLAPQ